MKVRDYGFLAGKQRLRYSEIYREMAGITVTILAATLSEPAQTILLSENSAIKIRHTSNVLPPTKTPPLFPV